MALSRQGFLPPSSLCRTTRPRGIGETVIDTPATTTPTRTSRPYWPALDGWRGLTIWFAISVHAGYFTAGGVLSLDTFFVLSGFLITGILLREWCAATSTVPGGSTCRRSGLAVPDGCFRDCSSCSRPCWCTRRSWRRRSGSTVCGATSRIDLLCSELALHRVGAVVLLVVHVTVAGAPPVVVGGRGAVLSVLAADRVGRAVAGTATVSCTGCRCRARRRRRARCGGLRRPDGIAVRPGWRSIARRLRDRHPSAGDVDGCRARGHRHLAWTAPVARGPRRVVDRCRRGLRHRRAPVVHVGRNASARRVLRAVRPARVLVATRSSSGVSHNRHRAARARPAAEPLHLGRRDLVRDVPLALAPLPRAHPRADRGLRVAAAVRATRVGGCARRGHALLRR